MTDRIPHFNGSATRFMSNFWPTAVRLDGWMYRSVEHAYQAAKSDNADDRLAILKAQAPGKAKQIGKAIALRPDWDLQRLVVMQGLLNHKFMRGTLLADMLDATGNATLEEGNSWGDTYWGICRGEGKNMLGLMLMGIRAENHLLDNIPT